jgi:hypothetical protein
MRSRIFLFLSCFQRGALGVDHGAWFQNLGQRIFVGHLLKAYQGGKVLTGDQPGCTGSTRRIWQGCIVYGMEEIMND